MKKNIAFVSILILVLFLIDRSGSFVLDKLYSKIKTGQTGGKINYYLSLDTLPEILIMGDSRAFYQIIPDSFDVKTYNLSHAGMGQSFQTGLLSILEQEKKLPSIILLHINIEEYSTNGQEENPFDVQNLKYYYGKNKLVTTYINEISEFEKYKYCFELYRYNGRAINLIKNLIETKRITSFGNGYEAMLPTVRDSLNTIYSAKKSLSISKPLFNYDRLTYLDRFLETCYENKIKLICFTSPFYNEFDFSMTAASVLDSIFKIRNIEYLNYSTNPIPALINHPSFWKDSGHLNHEGAKILTSDLAHRVEEILIGLSIKQGASNKN